MVGDATREHGICVELSNPHFLTHTLATHLLVEPRPSYPPRFIPTLVKATGDRRLTHQPEWDRRLGHREISTRKFWIRRSIFTEPWALGSIGASGK